MMKTLLVVKTWPVSLANAMIVFIMLASAIVFTFLLHFLNQEVEDVFTVMNKRILKDESALVVHRIGMYLNRPDAAATLLSHSLTKYPTDSVDSVRHELHHLMTVDFNKTEPLSRISFAAASGRYTGFSYDHKRHQLHLITSEHDADNANPTALVTRLGDVTTSAVMQRIPGYDVRKRPWFIQAMQTRAPFWTSNYHHASHDNGVVMSYRKPLTDAQGQFLGVISVDIHPDNLGRWLRKLAGSQKKDLLLMDHAGQVIAWSGNLSADKLSAFGCQSQQQCTVPAITKETDGTITELPAQPFLKLVLPVSDDDGLLDWRLVMLSPSDPWALLISHYHLRNVFILMGVIFIAALLHCCIADKPYAEICHPSLYCTYRKSTAGRYAGMEC